MPHTRAVALVGVGIVLGWLVLALHAWAGTSYSMQEVLNLVLDATFRGVRPAPALIQAGLLHNAVTSTGPSNAVRADGYHKKSVQVEIAAGTATIQVEWRLQSGTYYPLTGCEAMTASGQKCDVIGNPIYELRANVTACASCTVTTRYQLEP